jgi:chromate reductase
MPTPVRILAFSGSARLESLNRKFLAFAVQALKDLGCGVTVADLNDYVLPLYHGDLEDMSGVPENAKRLIALIVSHQGLLVASPEYNSMITPLLKNTIDWCTREDDNPFTGKPAAVISASPGPLGGARSLIMAQALLLRVGCQIVPGQVFLPHASGAFDSGGRLTDERAQKSAKELMERLAREASRPPA